MNTLYPWLKPLWQQWQPSLTQASFTQACLLSAASGLGASTLVEVLAKTLLCKSSNEEACGFCHSCDLFDAGTHPDFHQVAPPEPGKSISVEQIRQCQAWAQQASQLAGQRIIWIHHAQAMTESASNALLKSLEEPSATCSYVLTVEKGSQLLPTITSRCQQWHIVTPEFSQGLSWLKQQADSQLAPLALTLAGGAPLLAQQLITDKAVGDYQKLESSLVNALEQPMFGAWNEVAKVAASDYAMTLTWLWLLLADAQKAQLGLKADQQLPGAERVAKLVEQQLLYTQTHRLSTLIDQFNTHSGLNRELLLLEWLMAF